MKTHDLKTEIQKSLDHVPDSVLENILTYLKAAESHSDDRVLLMRRLKQILSEDKELLEKLAQ